MSLNFFQSTQVMYEKQTVQQNREAEVALTWEIIK